MEELELKIPIKLPKNKSLAEIKKYFVRNGLEILVKKKSTLSDKPKDLRFSKSLYKPELKDLYRLHQFIILNKRIKVLEYGTGWSTLVISNALKKNELKYKLQVKNLRFKNKFTVTVIDNVKKYLKISKDRIKKYYKSKKNNTFFYFSENQMTKYNKQICSYFVNHPRINPDFIYMDGPDQFKIKGKVNNLTISDYEMMPMNADVLSFENFLTPGTIILFDGRTANARFFKSNFRKDWKYIEDAKNDQNLFYLNERPLGESNKKQLNFYKK